MVDARYPRKVPGLMMFYFAGKTTTTEFTVTNSGPETTNPHNPNRTPGGSSCGSAAAVADFQVPLSLGGQTGGSLIRPASFTGVFAMKPTHNAISPEGQKSFLLPLIPLGSWPAAYRTYSSLRISLASRTTRSPKTYLSRRLPSLWSRARCGIGRGRAR